VRLLRPFVAWDSAPTIVWPSVLGDKVRGAGDNGPGEEDIKDNIEKDVNLVVKVEER
jgi:hypothetical protein